MVLFPIVLVYASSKNLSSSSKIRISHWSLCCLPIFGVFFFQIMYTVQPNMALNFIMKMSRSYIFTYHVLVTFENRLYLCWHEQYGPQYDRKDFYNLTRKNPFLRQCEQYGPQDDRTDFNSMSSVYTQTISSGILLLWHCFTRCKESTSNDDIHDDCQLVKHSKHIWESHADGHDVYWDHHVAESRTVKRKDGSSENSRGRGSGAESQLSMTEQCHHKDEWLVTC